MAKLEHHLKLMIGDLVMTVAQLQAENDALREQLPPASPASAPEPGNAPPPGDLDKGDA